MHEGKGVKQSRDNEDIMNKKYIYTKSVIPTIATTTTPQSVYHHSRNQHNTNFVCVRVRACVAVYSPRAHGIVLGSTRGSRISWNVKQNQLLAKYYTRRTQHTHTERKSNRILQKKLHWKRGTAPEAEVARKP